MKIISVINQKGGVAKTSSVIEIAAWMAYEKKKVLLIDLDQQANLTNYVGIDETDEEGNPIKTIYDAMIGDVKSYEIIRHLDYGKNVAFDVLPGTSKLSNAEKLFPEMDDVFKVAELIDDIVDTNIEYDYIIIDTNPARNQLLKMAYSASDYAIIPTTSDSGSLDGIVAIYQDIDKCRSGRLKITDIKILALLLTRFERSGSYSSAYDSCKDLAEGMEDKPDVAIIHKSIRVSDCKDVRMPLLIVERSNAASLDYKDFTRSIIRKLEGE